MSDTPMQDSDLNKQNAIQALVQRYLKEGQSRWDRPPTTEELLYFYDHWPFLRITDADEEAERTSVSIVEAKTHWKIHNHGDMLASSVGEWMFGGGDFRVMPSLPLGAEDEDDEGGEGDPVVNPRQGTIINQAVNTAREMVELAHKAGWKNIKILLGHRFMAWAAWIKASELGMQVYGYQPQDSDHNRYVRYVSSAEDDQKRAVSGRK